MRYIADTVDFELKEPTVVTLGKFDGRHRGHQKLLRTMEEVKESLGYATAIFTFSTAPLTLVTGETATVITTSEERRHNMEKMGIDYLVEYPFTDDVRKMDPAVFVKDILYKYSRIHFPHIICKRIFHQIINSHFFHIMPAFFTCSDHSGCFSCYKSKRSSTECKNSSCIAQAFFYFFHCTKELLVSPVSSIKFPKSHNCRLFQFKIHCICYISHWFLSPSGINIFQGFHQCFSSWYS